MSLNSLNSSEDNGLEIPNTRTQRGGLDRFKSRFWKNAALLFSLAVGENLRENDDLDLDAQTENIQMISNGTNMEVHETAPVEFTAVEINTEALKRTI